MYPDNENDDAIAGNVHNAVQDNEVGDVCFLFYRFLVNAWKKDPRWRTVHKMYETLLETNDKFPLCTAKVAAELAWQVFFQEYVMPYERTKKIENGDI